MKDGIAAIALATVLAGCVAPSVPPSPFREEGYFRDSMKNRIYSVSMGSTISKDDILKDGMAKPFTVGQVTAAYYFEGSATPPRDGLTLAKTFHDANRVLYEDKSISPWRYAFMRSFTGAEPSVIDCHETPEDGLCRR
ncbi:hypothetical protein JY409_04555 [Stenotrophomonas maltophilia]|nr:hypothetical protein [Stenotrophomonas maltophilia]